MKKAVFVLLALLLSAGAAWAGEDDGLDRYYQTYVSGMRGYTSTVLAREFNIDEDAIKAALAGKPVVVEGIIESAREATYYADPANAASAQGRALAIQLEVRYNLGTFVGYLFDDTEPLERLPKVVRKDSFGAKLLCEDVQRGPGGVGLQAKCRLYELYRLWVQDANAYHNQEIRIWLNSYPSGIPAFFYADLLDEFKGDDGPAIKAKLKNKPALVTGLVREVKEEDYFTNPSDSTSNQGKVMSIKFSRYGNTFMGYLFDDPIDPSILIKGEHTARLLCNEIQPGVGGVDMQGKCKVVEVIEPGVYVNQELKTLLEAE